jgi:hypothetical protein
LWKQGKERIEGKSSRSICTVSEQELIDGTAKYLPQPANLPAKHSRHASARRRHMTYPVGDHHGNLSHWQKAKGATAANVSSPSLRHPTKALPTV